MKKALLSAAFVTALLAPTAHAAIVNSWDVGTWTRFDLNTVNPPCTANPLTDPNGMHCYSDQSLRWGQPAGTGGKSGIDITNGGSLPNPFISTPVITNGSGADNVVITHYNQPIYGTSLSSVTIVSTLFLKPTSDPDFDLAGLQTFKINFRETPNGDTGDPCEGGGTSGAPNTINANGCSDIFVIDKKALNFAFWYNDATDTLSDTAQSGFQKYYLSFFEKTGGFTTLDPAACTAANASAPCLGFRTAEGLNTPAPFAVTITTDPITIPEPGTLGLLGIALTGLALSRRRRNI